MLDTAASLCNWSLKHAVAASLLSHEGITGRRKRDGAKMCVCACAGGIERGGWRRREGGREGGNEGGKEGGREGWREGREGERGRARERESERARARVRESVCERERVSESERIRERDNEKQRKRVCGWKERGRKGREDRGGERERVSWSLQNPTSFAHFFRHVHTRKHTKHKHKHKHTAAGQNPSRKSRVVLPPPLL
jgi:hypothetical protein